MKMQQTFYVVRLVLQATRYTNVTYYDSDRGMSSIKVLDFDLLKNSLVSDSTYNYQTSRFDI